VGDLTEEIRHRFQKIDEVVTGLLDCLFVYTLTIPRQKLYDQAIILKDASRFGEHIRIPQVFCASNQVSYLSDTVKRF
jgi:hypothetical protein